MDSLAEVLDSLKSSVAKARQEALTKIRDVFSRDRVVANLHKDSRAWLVVFQALFSAVLSEKDAFTKKKAASVAQKRLADAASTVRWLTERTVHHMNDKVIKALFDHLIHTMVHRGELLAPVALDYIKALRCIVNFAPHLDQTEDAIWVSIVERGFNIVLGDPVRSVFEDDTTTPTLAPEEGDSDLFDSDQMNVDSDNADVLPSSSRKRARSDSGSTARPSHHKSSSRHNNRKLMSVSHEQVEFMAVLSLLLRSHGAPLISSNYPHLARSILLRLQRFLDMYPPDTSLIHDYIAILSSILPSLSLNRIFDVQNFARSSWDQLLGLWGTKNKRIKEGLVVILCILFPCVTFEIDAHPGGIPFDCAGAITRLSLLLQGEADSRWGVDGLSLDSLRLELATSYTDQNPEELAFAARTFRSGWNFDESQALAWAILELQADCVGKLFQLSEAVHPPATPGTTLREGKRMRLENPIASLLALIQNRAAPGIRSYHLQILLFVIDRQWLILHHGLQHQVVQTLLGFLSVEDSTVLSWVFLCLAGVAYAEGARTQGSPSEGGSHQENGATWDSIWTNAIRRANVPVVCRAACHAAYSIIFHAYGQKPGASRVPLASQRILLEIETLAKDLDVQGPPFPYDSVCTFLAHCLKVSSQDMRLYRMQLEEKVLTWLVDSWKVVEVYKKTLPLHMVNDIIQLLESICGFSRRCDLVSRILLPGCQISAMLVEDKKTKVIREFLLYARLPNLILPKSEVIVPKDSARNEGFESPNEMQFIQPRGRERRITGFLLKSIEHLLLAWEDGTTHPAAETARRSLDMAVIALSFETVLVLNGTQSNRRLIQCACKLVGIITALLQNTRWTPAEKALISLGLEPLICMERGSNSEAPWDAMLPPDSGSGIKIEHIGLLNTHQMGERGEAMHSRMKFLRILWQNADVQSAFSDIANTLRNVLRNILASTTSDLTADEKDGFEPVRTATARQPSELCQDASFFRLTLDMCIAFLTFGPTLQSASREPTRDKDLIELVLPCAKHNPEIFMLVLPIIVEKVYQRTLKFSVKNFDDILLALDNLLQKNVYSKSERLRSLVIQILDSTLDLWTSREGIVGDDILENIQDLVVWLAKALQNRKIRAWPVRDALARFFSKYLDKDPTQTTWSEEKAKESKPEARTPSTQLPLLGRDEDMRVRFRVAALNARLFATARHTHRHPPDVYETIRKSYTIDIDDYEHMLTRMLSLGNIMIRSSAVRRGPYWHLLETCIHSPHYSAHIESILHGVSQRLGMDTLSVLFESYASQFAFSIRQAQSDILRFPPHLLGFQDRMACAEATFHSFTPTNIWNSGRRLFEAHCKVLSKSCDDGIRECFSDIIGYQVVTWINQQNAKLDALEPLLRATTLPDEGFQDSFMRNVDGIVVSILRTLGDQDFSDNGPIIQALGGADQTGQIVRAFNGLTRYRRVEAFETHGPNLPAFPTEIILRAFDWLRSQVSDVDAKATTYHVLHQLFAEVEQSPLINEQNRLLNAISLWIAFHHQDFDDLTLLHTLINGATTLLSQGDLARTSQSILDWSLSIYRRGKVKHPRIPDILLRICRLAHDYASSNLGETVSSMGDELLQWIDTQALKLSKIPAFLGQVKSALPAWPHQPSMQLAQLYDSITSESLSTVIDDPRIASSKFRVVRRLRDHAVANDYDGTNFATSDFWRLKECIPPVQHLQDADADAFADLLYLCQGRLDSFRCESTNSTSILTRHKRLPKDSRNDADTAQEPITLALLARLQGDSASRSYAAYQTLRLIKSVSTEALANVHISSSEHLIELQYLEAYRRSPRPQLHRDLGELLAKEEYTDSARDFPMWIAQITTLFSEVLSMNDAFYAQLTPILHADTEFAEEALPVLVHTLLRVGTVSPFSNNISCRTLLSAYFTGVLSSGLTSTPCLRSTLDIVLHLRNFSVRKVFSSSDRISQDPLSYNKWLDIDFMLLARSAIICGAYTTALLFLELAVDNPSVVPAKHTSCEQIMYEIYRHIDEPDGFYGIHDEDLHQNLMKRFHHEKQWERAFRFHGAALEAGLSQVGHAEGLIQSFHSFGFDHLANDALRGASFQAENKELSSTSYRLAWRTETWDLPDCDEQSTGASLYLALRAIHRERDGRAVDDIIQNGLNNGMERLRCLGSESFTEIREVVQDLMCLREVAKWRHDPVRSDLNAKQISMDSRRLFIDIDPRFDFSDLENIIATRISLVRSARTREERQQIGTLIAPFTQDLIDIEKKCLIRLSSAARAADQVQIALNSVVRAQRLDKAPSFSVFEEFASVLWSQGEEKLAVEYLDRLRCDDGRKHVQDPIAEIQTALLLSRLGAWSSQACLKKPTDIQRDYFTAAVDVLRHTNMSDATDSQVSHAAVYHECAIFAERQYHEIVKSPDAIRWKIYVDRKQQEIQARSQDLLRTQYDSKDYRTLETRQKRAQKLLEEDSEMYRAHNIARDTFLKQAIDMYSRCLSASDSFDGDAGIRLCSIWFANFEDDDTGLQGEVQIALDRIPSRKLVFLAHQLSARISKPASGHIPKSQRNLQKLVLRMCHEHPFHSLYQVYCLQPDRPSGSSGRRQSGRISAPPLHTERSAAAGDIFDRLRSDATTGGRVRDIETLCDACMDWAKYPIKGEPKYKTTRDQVQFKVPEQAAIGKISRLRVPVMTHRTALDPTLLYDNCIWIDHYESTFTTAGGINLPKIVSCVGSDGSKYKQLFKGEGDDDLRQDAVMEQVFELVNNVLRRDRETRRRLLSVRDYKVIPLGSQAGLLEFVGNTCPLTKWLLPAHARYHPGDLTHQAAGPAIAKIQAEHKGDLDKLVQEFEALKMKFRPVMRHYFTEKHKTPIAWFAMKLNYTRSVATTSIVGHILGLGDRHIANILLDNMSGQVIHIDLGIAFDQGKLLPVPELVPFRMTRDMIDGMGMSGTSGVFHRCAEETLRVLREDSEVIMTVLEVFKYDPLHSWTASDVKIKRVQQIPSNATSTSRFGTGIGIDMSSGTAEEAADRALSAVARKLDKALSVQYTVNQLIRDATDSRNLARIYKGWSALC